MTPAEEQSLVDDWKAGDIVAGGDIVRMHERIIRSLARHYESPRCEVDDLMQVGRMALLRYAHRFDSSRASLGTFAYLTVRKAQYLYARRGRSVVSISEDPSAKDVRPFIVWLDAETPSHGGAHEGGGGPTSDFFEAQEVDVDCAVDAGSILNSLCGRERSVIERHVCHDEELVKVGASFGVSKQAIAATRDRVLTRLREAVQTSSR